MKIREMLYDAAKYPLTGIKQLLLLGLMILIISLLLGDYSSFYNYFEATFGDNALLLLVLVILLTSAVFIIFEAGYTFKIIEKSVLMHDKPPKLNNFVSLFKHGIKEFILLIIYFAVPAILLIILLDYTISGVELGLPQISDEIAFVIIITVILLGFLADILFKVAIPHMAFKGGAFKEAFNFTEIFKKIKEIGFKKLLIGYFIVILGLVVVAGPILKEFIGTTNIFGFLFAEEILAPYFIMFAARFTALIYRESILH